MGHSLLVTIWVENKDPRIYVYVTKKPPPFNFVLSPNGEVYNDM